MELYQNKEVCKYLLHQPWQPNDAEKLFEEKLSNNVLTEDQTLNLACELEGKVIGDVSV